MEQGNSSKEKEESKSVTKNINQSWIDLETITTFDLDTETNDDARPVVSRNGNNSNNRIINNENIISILNRILTFIRYFLISCKLDKSQKDVLYDVVCKKLSTLDFLTLTDKEIYKIKCNTICDIASVAKEMSGNNIHGHAMLSLLRYHDNFIEKSLIATGGFGTVYMAKNCLDGIVYAVKKIKFSTDNMENIQTYLDEVKTLAKLDHTNIVSYKTAWIEPIWESSSVAASVASDTSFNQNISKLYEDSQSTFSSQENNENINDSNIDDKYDNKIGNITGTYKRQTSCLTTKVVKQRNTNVLRTTTSSTDSDNIEIIFKDSNENSNKSKDTKHKQTNADHEVSNQSQMCTTSSKNSQSAKQKYILYIQMALCEATLENWMSKRVTQTPQPIILAVLQQICSGINYIHSQNIIHHDIKPTNIFISTSGEFRVQLGDFGLACSLQKDNHAKLGTEFYAAPEQLNGKCNPKSDIYSIGIVLMELLILMKTRTEFSHMVQQFKCNKIPEIVPAKRHKLAYMVIEMIQNDPDKRPSSKELLDILKKDKNMQINGLKHEIKILKQNIDERDITNQKLQEENALLKEQIKNLSKRLQI